MDWFRSWHGAPTDPKWLVVARRSHSEGVTPGMVSALAWALLDYASQHVERGSIDGFDIETYAAFTDWGEDQIEAIIGAMRDKGIITKDNRLVSWEKRQPKKEDDSSQRVKAFRERERALQAALQKDVTLCNDSVTPGNAASRDVTTDKIREEEREKNREETQRSAQAPSADADSMPPQTLGDWHYLLKESKNKQAILRQMFETLYPGAVEIPEYSYIGRVAKTVGGAGRLAELFWLNSAKPPSGDVLAYIQAHAKAPSRNGNDPDAQSEAYRRRMKALLGEDTTDGN